MCYNIFKDAIVAFNIGEYFTKSKERDMKKMLAKFVAVAVMGTTLAACAPQMPPQGGGYEYSYSYQQGQPQQGQPQQGQPQQPYPPQQQPQQSGWQKAATVAGVATAVIGVGTLIYTIIDRHRR